MMRFCFYIACFVALLAHSQVDLQAHIEQSLRTKKQEAKSDSSTQRPPNKDSLVLRIVELIDSGFIKSDMSEKEIEEILKEKVTLVRPNLGLDTAGLIARQEFAKERSILQHKGIKASSEQEWGSKKGLAGFSGYKKEHTLSKDQVVFGWHPFWMGDAYKYYNFSLLSHVAYFGYELNEVTGGYKSIHQWRETSIIDSVHAYGNKALLCVTLFGKKKTRLFLENKTAQNNFTKEVVNVLREKNGDGLNLDFERVPNDQRDNLTNFIINLAQSLRKVNKEYELTVSLPAFDFRNVYDIQQIQGYVDFFVVMGYEFYGQTSTNAGPIAPIESGNIWWEFNLQRSVDEYLIQGVQKDKFVMAVPYYGAEWKTEDLKLPSKSLDFKSYRTYSQIQKIAGNVSCCLDETSKGKYFVYRNGESEYRQIWYEDTTSLKHKYDWIKESGLRGVGIWALGYDHGRTELWELLGREFSSKDTTVRMVQAGSSFSFRRLMMWGRRGMMYLSNPTSILRNPAPILRILGGAFGFGVCGWLLFWRFGSRWGKRRKIAVKGSLLGMLMLFVVLMAVLLFSLGSGEGVSSMKSNDLKLIYFSLIGFVIGLFLMLFISRKYLSDKELP